MNFEINVKDGENKYLMQYYDLSLYELIVDFNTHFDKSIAYILHFGSSWGAIHIHFYKEIKKK